MKHVAKYEIEELDLVSAIWILASNDETSLITYRGIQYRLDLPTAFDIKALIARRPELFRPGANPAHGKKEKGVRSCKITLDTVISSHG